MRNVQRHHAFTERRPSVDLTPEYEDFGLFKSDVLPVEVQMTPMIYRNSRNDLIVRGFTQTEQKFEVVFAGRRAAMAGPLITNLEALKSSFLKQLKGKTDGPLSLETIRLPVLVEGSWRRRHWTDDTGWQRHINQLVAARWSVNGADGRTVRFGISPSHVAGPSLPVMGHGGAGEGGHIQQTARGN